MKPDLKKLLYDALHQVLLALTMLLLRNLEREKLTQWLLRNLKLENLRRQKDDRLMFDGQTSRRKAHLGFSA